MRSVWLFLSVLMSVGFKAPLWSQERGASHTFPNLTIVQHPLVQHKLTHLRSKETGARNFPQLLKEISMLLGYEVTRFIPAIPRPIQTPLEAMVGVKIKSRSIVLVPILRAGLGFLEGMRTLIPFADVGHIGLYRDEKTRRPVSYYVRLPKVSNQRFIILDPMMATGNSACAAISMLLDRGVPRRNIIFMALVVAPEGVRRFNKNFSDIPIIAACLDRCLDKRAYIRPGLGDAGDRLFGTP